MKTKILKSLYRLLACCSRVYIKRTKTTIVGITGTVGKTTCRMVIAHILSNYFIGKRVYTSPRNYNSEIGLVLSIFGIENYNSSPLSLLSLVFKILFRSLFMSKKYDVLVLEYGIDRPLDMEFLLTVAIPDIAVFTKLDYTHSEFFGSKQKVGEEKIKLLKNAKKKAYLNIKDDFCVSIYDDISLDKEYYFKDENIKAYKFYANEKNDCRSSFTTLGVDIITNAMGEANAHYINLGFRILKDLGGAIPQGERYLTFEGQNGRFTILKGIGGSVLIDSSYNAGPESMKKIITDTLELKRLLFKDYKLAFVLGDMREIGESSKESHEAIIGQIRTANLLLTVGEETSKYLKEGTKGLEKIEVQNFLSSKKAGQYLKDKLLLDDSKYIILFKGSQNTIFVEEALKQVLQDKSDEIKLVRQSTPWGKRKKEFFDQVESEGK